MIESLIWHIKNFLSSEKLVILPLSIGVSFIFSVAFIMISMPILTRFGIIDRPSARRAHKTPTVRGGGIALVFSFIFTLFFVDMNASHQISIMPLIIPVAILALVSFADDVREVSIIFRLLIHFLCAYLCVNFFISPHLIFRGEVSPALDIFLCVFALVGFTNIYNFLDGIDGISAMQSIHLSLTAIILCIIRDKVIINIDIVFYISSILLGCSIAFLLFNWNPARIFIGDVGSTFLGLLHGLNLLIIASSSERLFLASSIASLYYIGDGGITILIRLCKGEKIWEPHLNHFFQQAVRKGMTQREIVLKISACNFILLILAVSSIYVPHISIILSILVTSFILVHFHYDKLIAK